jgi:4-hydroxybenzoate polyprenyltransferase
VTSRLRPLAELVRAPAALTVPGDVVAGAAACGWPFGAGTAALAASSVCLYWAGMALNDYADREVDARERPGRPIPSGRVSPGTALAVAAGLTAGGIGLAGAAGGRRAVAVTVPLAATVWAYDLARVPAGPGRFVPVKTTWAGPVLMATARGLDVLVGAGRGRLRQALPAAATVGAHTLAVTMLSRMETLGAKPAAPLAAMAATGSVAAGALIVGPRGPSRRPGPAGAGSWLVGAGLLAAFAVTCGEAQSAAVQLPSPRRLQRAVGAGILGMIPLQAGLTARAGSMRAALAVAAALPVARQLSARISPT